jgi:hypothetical protein
MVLLLGNALTFFQDVFNKEEKEANGNPKEKTVYVIVF